MANKSVITAEILSLYIQRIQKFIGSNNKVLLLPCISTELTDIYVKIVQEGVGFLQDEMFSEMVKLEGNKLGLVMEAHKNVKLIHKFIDGTPNRSKAVMYKKVEATFKDPEPSKASEVQTSNLDENPVSPNTEVTLTFKTWCLNSTLKFVKDDSQLVKKFPPMSSEQAGFVMTTVLQGIDGNEQTDIGYGYRSMYAPLWEAMRLFRLKYRYTLRCDDGLDNLKEVIFEKIPNFKLVEPEKVEEEMPKLDDNQDTKSAVPSVSDSGPTPTVTNALNKLGKGRKPTAVDRIITFIGEGKITKVFIEDALKRMAIFLYTEEEASIIFSQMQISHIYFLRHIHKLCRAEEAYTIFNSECQKYLQYIKSIVPPNVSYNTLYTVRKISEVNGRTQQIKALVEKKTVFLNDQTATDFKLTMKETKQSHDSSADSTIATTKAPLTEEEQETLIEYKRIKDLVELTYGESFIVKLLRDIRDFLTPTLKIKKITFEAMNEVQESFIRCVDDWCRMEEVYPMFGEECRTLLAEIRANAEGYVLEYSSFEWYGGADGNEVFSDVTIFKKPFGRAKKQQIAYEKQKRAMSLIESRRGPKRATSPSSSRRSSRAEAVPAQTARRFSNNNKTGKEELMAALAQPVQCSKAAKMMQSMGWTGGALGLRGDGITEPIMPALDTINRAGIGHGRYRPRHANYSLKTQEKYPKTQETYPKTQETYPKAQEKYPKTQETYPKTQGKYPNTQEIIPRAQEKYPKTQESYTKAQEKYPMTQESYTEAQEKYPKAQETYPKAQETYPKAQETYPKAQETYPKAQKPPTNIGVSDLLPNGRKLSAIPSMTPPDIVKPDPYKTIHLSTNYREYILKHVVILLTSDANEDTIKFQYAKMRLKKRSKVYNFIAEVCRVVNARKRMKLDAKAEVKLVDKIVRELETQTDVLICQEWVDERSCYVFKKTIESKTTSEAKVDVVIDLTSDDIPESQIDRPMETRSIDVVNIKKVTTTEYNKTDEVNKNIAQQLDIIKSNTDKYDTAYNEHIQNKDTIEYITEVLTKVTIESHDTAKDLETDDNLIGELSEIIYSNEKSTEKQWTESGQINDKNEGNIIESLSKTNDKRTDVFEYNNNNNVKVYNYNNGELSDNIQDNSDKPNIIPDVDGTLVVDNSIAFDDKSNIISLGNKTNTFFSGDKTNIHSSDDQINLFSNAIDKTNRIPLADKNNEIASDDIITSGDETNKIASNDTTDIISADENININLSDAKVNLFSADDETNRIALEDQNNGITLDDVNYSGDETNRIASNDKINTISADDNTNIIAINDETNVIPLENTTDDFSLHDNTDINSSEHKANIFFSEEKNKIIAINDETNRTNYSSIIIDSDDKVTHNDENVDDGTKDNNDKVKDEDWNHCETLRDKSDDSLIYSNQEELLHFSKTETDSNKIHTTINNNKTSKLLVQDLNTPGKNVHENVSKEGNSEKSDSGISPHRHGIRRSLDSPTEKQPLKKIKLAVNFKTLCIIHKDYPQTKINTEKAREIQMSVVNHIDFKDKIPLLTCEGIQNGGLVYGCHDEKTVLFMEDLIKNIHDLRILYKFDAIKIQTHKMAFKMVNLVEENVSDILKRIEQYNNGLNATRWEVIKKEQYPQYIVVYVKLNEVSLNYIRDSNFVLFAGNDSAKFTIIWD